jgi:hypothetical protein
MTRRILIKIRIEIFKKKKRRKEHAATFFILVRMEISTPFLHQIRLCPLKLLETIHNYVSDRHQILMCDFL